MEVLGTVFKFRKGVAIMKYFLTEDPDMWMSKKSFYKTMFVIYDLNGGTSQHKQLGDFYYTFYDKVMDKIPQTTWFHAKEWTP